jgi:hypothetical protein
MSLSTPAPRAYPVMGRTLSATSFCEPVRGKVVSSKDVIVVMLLSAVCGCGCEALGEQLCKRYSCKRYSPQTDRQTDTHTESGTNAATMPLAKNPKSQRLYVLVHLCCKVTVY